MAPDNVENMIHRTPDTLQWAKNVEIEAPLHLLKVPGSWPSPYPKRHHDRFSVFVRRTCDQQTDAQLQVIETEKHQEHAGMIKEITNGLV